MAKNRMQKFYNPKLAKAAFVQRQRSEEDGSGSDAGTGSEAFVQIKMHNDVEDTNELPEAPPALLSYETKKQEASGVIAMMDSLIADLDKEITELTLEEKDSQGDYEET